MDATATPPINVLISLHRGYGLGDAVQVSAVLRHVTKYRPHWVVDYQAEEGRHQCGRGIAARTFAYGDDYPSPYYHAEVQLVLYDNWHAYHDRPNTRVSSCLSTCLGLPWDPECGRYQVAVSQRSREAAMALTAPGCKHRSVEKWGETKMVAVHYRGDTSPAKKNLSHEQAASVCKSIARLRHTPLLLDWRNESPLRKEYRTCGELPTSALWGGDAEMNCAVIAGCRAFVGIDSGPAKCASATNVSALVVWTGHHPAQFHDPAPNTTHLVPRGYHDLAPVCGDYGVADWFEAYYRVRQYDGDPVREIDRWLKEVLE